VPALFGIATVWLVLSLRRHLGTVGALGGAALLAISPGAVYLSRYFIHETLFVFFTLGVVVAFLRYYEDGHPVYLLLGSISAALMFATKETAVISVAVLVIALVTTQVYLALRAKPVRGRSASKDIGKKLLDFVERAGGPGTLSMLVALGVLVFIGQNVLFYSSFFTNYPKGVFDALRTFQFWTKTGQEAHVHPLYTYVYWLIRQESPLLFLGVIGAAITVWRPRNAFALFSALWAFGLIAAYSLIAYKTPWLTLNFIVPLTLIGGYAVQFLYEIDWLGGRFVAVLMLAAVIVGGYQTIDLNFRNYDNDDPGYVYVYAHTRRETLALVTEISKVAQQSKQGGQMGITIVSPDYWPLPWYLRDYSRVGYFGRMTDSGEAVIIAAESQLPEAKERFGFRYQQLQSGLNQTGTFALRPGVNLVLLVRKDLLVLPPG
jgi:uncharacterized protein (TIGR03663 family)